MHIQNIGYPYNILNIGSTGKLKEGNSSLVKYELKELTDLTNVGSYTIGVHGIVSIRFLFYHSHKNSLNGLIYDNLHLFNEVA